VLTRSSGRTGHRAGVTLSPARRRRPRRRRGRPLLIAGVVVLAAAVVAAIAVPHRGRHTGASTTLSLPPKETVARRVVLRSPARLVERRTGTLAAAVQDAAATRVPGGVMLLGGLTAADQSRPDVLVATARHDRPAGTLPVALHDTAAVTIGSSVY